MKALQFTEQNGKWESQEFQVSGDFNLHVDRERAGLFGLLQKTNGSRFANVISSGAFHNDTVIDTDVQVLIPKTFKVISYSKVIEAFYDEGI